MYGAGISQPDASRLAWCGQVPLLPRGPASPQSTYAHVSKGASPSRRRCPAQPPSYLPLQEVAPELLEVVQVEASPMLGMRHLVKVNVPRREEEAILPTPAMPPSYTPKRCSSCSQVLSPISLGVRAWALATGKKKKVLSAYWPLV